MDKVYTDSEFLVDASSDLSPNEKMFRCTTCQRVFYYKYDARFCFIHKAGKIWLPMNTWNGKPDWDYVYISGKRTTILYSIHCPRCKSDKTLDTHIDESTPLLFVGFVRLKNGKTLKVK